MKNLFFLESVCMNFLAFHNYVIPVGNYHPTYTYWEHLSTGFGVQAQGLGQQTTLLKYYNENLSLTYPI